jgi:hypothetical protein
LPPSQDNILSGCHGKCYGGVRALDLMIVVIAQRVSQFFSISFSFFDRQKLNRKNNFLLPRQEPDQMAAIFGPFLNQAQPTQIDSALCRKMFGMLAKNH